MTAGNNFVAENLVHWARPETIGHTVNPAASGSGMMESWNVGMLKIRRRTGFIGIRSTFYKDGTDQFIKSDRHPLFDSQYSIIPFGV